MKEHFILKISEQNFIFQKAFFFSYFPSVSLEKKYI